jgi:hypothetical protein
VVSRGSGNHRLTWITPTQIAPSTNSAEDWLTCLTENTAAAAGSCIMSRSTVQTGKNPPFVTRGWACKCGENRGLIDVESIATFRFRRFSRSYHLHFPAEPALNSACTSVAFSARLNISSSSKLPVKNSPPPKPDSCEPIRSGTPAELKERLS